MNERISNVINHPARTPVIVGLVSFGSGLVAGYFFAKRQKAQEGIVIDVQEVLDDKPEGVQDDIETQLADIRARREARQVAQVQREATNADSEKLHPSFDPETVSSGQKLVEQMARKGKTTIIPFVPDEAEEAQEVEVIRSSIFAENGDDEWDYRKELDGRNSAGIYVLHKDEYFARELGFSQRIFTYYAGDDTMYDDEEKHPVYSYQNVVGELKFGHGSGDRNVFFVRNMKEKCEYEIFHDRGLYAIEVAGVDPDDIEDEHPSEPRRMRTER